MARIFNKHIGLVQSGLITLLALSCLYLLLLSFKIPIPYIKLSTLHKLIFSSGELLSLVLLYQRYLQDGRRTNWGVYFLRDLLVFNCIFLYPFIQFYTDPIKIEILLISRIRPYLIAGYLGLLLITGLVLYVMGDIKRARLWLKLKLDFQGTGTGYLIAILILAGIGLTLRLWRLDGLPPYMDELIHFRVAKEISQGMPLDQIVYRRSLYTVTLPVAISFKLFGVNLWAARFPGVVVNILALIPLVLLCKRINWPVALLAVLLYVFSPWIIAVSRNVREYAYYPVFFYSIALIMVKLYEALPDGIIFHRDYRLLFRWKNLLYLGLLVFVLYFVIAIDKLSTLKMVLLFYPVFALLLIRKIDWHNSKNIALSLILLIAGFVTLAVLSDSVISPFLHVGFEGRNSAFFPALFFEKPAQQWYYNRPLISVAIFTLAMLAIYFFDKKEFILPFALLTFLGELLAISVFLLKGERPRYAVNIEIWFIVLMATGLFCAFKIAEKRFGNKYQWIIGAVLIGFFFNVPHIINVSLYDKSGWHPITNEFHAAIAPALQFLQSKISKDDAIVTTGLIDSYANIFTPGLLNGNIVPYNGDPDDGRIYSAIDTSQKGWIVLDRFGGYYYSRPVPLHNFLYHGKRVKFLGWYGDVYILKWEGDKK